ncbi:MAG: hypothetical protein IT204_23320 [Fimbriimonadaceae bacterium]|nr:hypothetical protein [Fimbriimonadaceae bacterium]
MRRVILLTTVLTAASAAEPPAAGLWVYPAPGQEEYRSAQYRVRVTQGETAQEAFCYRMRSIWHHEFPGPWPAQFFPRENHWASFSFAGQVTVELEALQARAVGVELRPAPTGIAASVVDGKVRLELSRPGQYYVLVKVAGHERFDFEHPFFLFANPPETDVPAPGTPGVQYYGPGVHDIGFQHRVSAGQTVYLAGGALVQGSLYCEGPQIRLRGRGILTDRRLMLQRVESALAAKAAGQANPWEPNHDRMYAAKWATIYADPTTTDLRLEGLTVIESPFYMIRTHGSGAVFQNLKLLGDLYNNNGIIAGPHHRILDCFLKVEDDVFCWMAPTSETRRCVIWKQDNSALVQLGYGYSYTTKDHVFADNWVVRDTATVQNMARGLFGLAASTGTQFTNCQIENLQVWGDVLNFLAIDNWDRPTPWATRPAGEVKLRPVELHFRNVSLSGTERGTWWGPHVADLQGTPLRSRLRTEGDGSIRIILENVIINGRRLTSDADWPHGLLRAGNVTVEYR